MTVSVPFEAQNKKFTASLQFGGTYMKRALWVVVQANATLVETRTVGVGQVVENALILELPLNGRQVGDLIGLAGGTAPATVPNGRDSLATPGFSVAGGLNTGINYTLDGGNHN